MTELVENANENNGPGPAGAIEQDKEQENQELQWAQRKVPYDESPLRPVRSVLRRTELHGTAPSSTQDAIKKKRKRTNRELKNPTGAVPYAAFEIAYRDFICSLMEHQDMLREEMFLHIADLQQQIIVLEHRMEQEKSGSPGIPEVEE